MSLLDKPMMDRPPVFLILLFMSLMALLVAVSNKLVQYVINDYLTWAAFTYPLTFLISDLSTRRLGVKVARLVAVVGFIVGVLLSVFIDVRIAMASGVAFLCAQLLDVEIFHRVWRRVRLWWFAPLLSSGLAAVLDTALFFSIAFVGTGVPWVSLAMGDYVVKMAIVMASLLPYRLLLPYLSVRLRQEA